VHNNVPAPRTAGTNADPTTTKLLVFVSILPPLNRIAQLVNLAGTHKNVTTIAPLTPPLVTIWAKLGSLVNL
jgi:hypothetical protein